VGDEVADVISDVREQQQDLELLPDRVNLLRVEKD
jgi:hypothetical protein